MKAEASPEQVSEVDNKQKMNDILQQNGKNAMIYHVLDME